MNADTETNQSNGNDGSNPQQQKTSKSLLARLLYIVLFFAVFNIVESIVFLLAAVCFVFALLKTEPPEGLIHLGGVLAKYVSQIVSFLTNNENTAPWPFTSWS